MANRDKSQRAGFVNANIYELYKKSQNQQGQAATASNLAKSPLSSSSRVWSAADLEGLQVTKFEPRALARPTAQIPANAVGPNPFDDLKSNLHKLQDLHSRLRFMLKELEDLVAKK